MTVVIALGGNALLRRGEPLDAGTHRRNAALAASVVATAARQHSVVVTHGNGPQIGLLALRSEAYQETRADPLDVLGAETEGMIGYLLEQELRNALPRREVATLLTQVVVDADDPAFLRPTKPIGPGYDHDEAEQIAHERGWAVAPDGGAWRRVVASPEPRSIVELGSIRLLNDAGVVVVCAGGGGIPVVVDSDGSLRGVEAVVDKDRAAALLAEQLGADVLVLLTDVAGAFVDWGTPDARLVRRADPHTVRTLPFAEGSMGPKVEAAARFAEATGGIALIGALEEAGAVLAGAAGTTISRSPVGIVLGPRDG